MSIEETLEVYTTTGQRTNQQDDNNHGSEADEANNDGKSSCDESDEPEDDHSDDIDRSEKDENDDFEWLEPIDVKVILHLLSTRAVNRRQLHPASLS